MDTSGDRGYVASSHAQNLFGETGLRVFAANPDGSPIWSMSPARTYELSNAFEF